MLTKEQILGVGQPHVEVVPIAALGGDVSVRHMPGMARDALQETLRTEGTSDSIYFAALMVAAIVDAAGLPVFTVDDMLELRALDYNVLKAVGQEIQRVNGIGPKAVETTEGNSGSAPSA